MYSLRDHCVCVCLSKIKMFVLFYELNCLVQNKHVVLWNIYLQKITTNAKKTSSHARLNHAVRMF